MAKPRSPAEAVRFSSVLLVVWVLVGTVLGVGLTRWTKRLPNDLERTGTILRALRDPGAHPGVVFFGDSVIMSGIDARIVQTQAHTSAPVWNLASTGQTLAESILYYQELPASVSTVVQAVRLPRLVAERDLPPLNAHVGNTFNINGYRPDQDTQRLLTDAFGEPLLKPLLAGPFGAAFESRWLIRQFIDTSLRKVVRTDLDAERGLRDFSYPQAFTRPLEPEKLRGQIEQNRALEACGACAFRDDYVEAIRALHMACEREGRRLIILISPVHPALRDMYTGLYPLLREAIETGTFGRSVDVADGTRLLLTDEFFDFQHPTPQGAKRLSHLAAQRLGGWH